MTTEQRNDLTTEPEESQQAAPRRLDAFYWAGALIWVGLVFGAESLGILPQIGESSAWIWIFLGGGLAGLALGSFTNCGSAEEIRRIVVDRLGGLNIPILAGFDVGHEAVNMTLPVGLPVGLDTHCGTLIFRGSAVRWP